MSENLKGNDLVAMALTGEPWDKQGCREEMLFLLRDLCEAGKLAVLDVSGCPWVPEWLDELCTETGGGCPGFLRMVQDLLENGVFAGNNPGIWDASVEHVSELCWAGAHVVAGVALEAGKIAGEPATTAVLRFFS